MGPMKQIKKMVALERLVSTLILLAAIVLTFVMGLVVKKVVLALLFSIISWLAYAWYVLSFIPYAQKCVKSIFTSCCGGGG